MGVTLPSVRGVQLATSAMATRFELVLQGDDPVALTSIGEAAIEEIESAHRLFTRFEGSSLLSHLRRTAPAAAAVDGATIELFEDLELLVNRSEQAFDPTRGTGWGRIRIDRDRRQVALDDSGTELDLGAIAKGHAIDQAITVLRHHGITSAFIHGGTSSGYALGRPVDGSAWRVRLGHDGPLVDLVDQAFGVSATYQVVDGQTVPHLIDPRTEAILRCRRRCAVVGPTARLADGWSTAIAVLGRRPVALSSEWRMWLADGHGWREVGA